MKETLIHTDVLIVGTGIAGLSCALEMAHLYPEYRITLLDKSFDRNSNSQHAQGGMAAVMSPDHDSFQSHFNDTLRAGRWVNQAAVVDYFVRKAPEAIHWLETLGVKFDKETLGDYQLGMEGGHAHPRIVHQKDWTGKEVLSVLWNCVIIHDRIKVLSGYLAKDLWGISFEYGGKLEKCCGIKGFDLSNGNPVIIHSDITILATGGCGRLFARTTNAEIATGDGVAMASRAGVELRDMHYYQFHPTALYDRQNGRALLLTEALRGAGAHIVNDQGERFLWKGDKRGELATRDIICALMENEMTSKGVDYLYLDARHLGSVCLKKNFPQVVGNCLGLGFHPAEDLLPILPAAHYQCGGIVVDLLGRSSLEGLYALGECASTGLHGKNRLASNSLTEGVVFARKLAKELVKFEISNPPLNISEGLKEMGKCSLEEVPQFLEIRTSLQKEMNKLIFSKDQITLINQVSSKVEKWKIIIERKQASKSGIELQNLLDVAEVMCKSFKDQLEEHAEHN
ncbi:L-aspartate oxidase [Echinicola rosea]|uniref:L-aspartate oxidase n=1 Tax=Echinicola rosea TaxID=1807691 RepID=A0ABQ1VB13_9BACT|nr:FAD-dependent oxidoreductase [Echinicola rosea]GGF50545.1 L-aspartate oxidase [Echinicola rosea]